MSRVSTNRVPVHWTYWAIAVLAVVWHLPAIANVVMQMNTELIAQSTDPMQALLAQRPGWATAAFAVFAIAGTLGSFLLLLRKSSAVYLFAISLLGVIVHFVGIMGIDKVTTEMKMGCIMSLVGGVLHLAQPAISQQRLD